MKKLVWAGILTAYFTANILLALYSIRWAPLVQVTR